jgi:mono/diheme cytochrome c family protein
VTVEGRKILFLAAVIGGALVISVHGSGQGGNDKEWTIPEGAAKEQNPVAATPDTLKTGLQIFQSKCQRCHGKDGMGRGPDADPLHKAGNLTDRIRAGFNPDGVMFYKVWNGRDKPKMPAFKADGMTREEAWTVVTYIKTLRR